MRCDRVQSGLRILLAVCWVVACNGDDGGGDAGSGGAAGGGSGRSGSGGDGGSGGSGGSGGAGSGAGARGGTGEAGTGGGGTGGSNSGPAFVLEQVAVGNNASCGVRADGTLWCWGYNKSGRTVGEPKSDVVGATQIGTDDDWAMVDAASSFRCALKSGGQVLCWGDAGSSGELGRVWNATREDRYPPVPIAVDGPWASLSAHTDRACAITTAGALYCWGGKPANVDGTPQQVGTDTDWEQVSVGSDHGCARKQAGTIHCWGSNEYGELGQGGVTFSEVDPTQPFPGIRSSDEPLQVGSDSDWAAVASGREHACALKSDGTIHCWGDNDDGELGTGSMMLSSSPVAVMGANDFAKVFAGGTSSCGITATDELWCWGTLYDETVGGGAEKSTMPVRIGSEHRWKSVDLDDAYHACALTTEGATYCWGGNFDGALGDGTAEERTGLVAVVPPG